MGSGILRDGVKELLKIKGRSVSHVPIMLSPSLPLSLNVCDHFFAFNKMNIGGSVFLPYSLLPPLLKELCFSFLFAPS